MYNVKFLKINAYIFCHSTSYIINLCVSCYFMDNIILLTDKSRLTEIYHLRIKAWRQHGLITVDNYPNGYYDNLDEDGLHWIVLKDNLIVGSARLNIVNKPEELPCPETFKRVIQFDNHPFFFYSRLVVDPNFQGSGLSCLLDEARLNFIRAHYDIKKVVATAGIRRAKKLEQYGFKILDKVIEQDDYKCMDGLETFIIELENE